MANYQYTDDVERYLHKLTYGNGDYVEYDYDSQGRLIKETFEDGNTVTYTYDNTGALATMTDSATGRTTTYYYDLIDRLAKHTEIGPNYEHSVTYTYDERNNLSKLVETVNGVEHVTEYAYNYENRLTETVTSDADGDEIASETVTYDDFGRLESTSIKKDGEAVISSWTTYQNGATAGTTTTQLTDLGFYSDEGYTIGSQYVYDDNGNITVYTPRAEYEYGANPLVDTLTRIGHSHYHYDTANQLVREDNAWLGKTFVWTYDDAGNITSRQEYNYIAPTAEVTGVPAEIYIYTYGDSTWGDLLTVYDGTPRAYDNIGNLINDGRWSYTWQNGRELATMTSGTTTWSYTYDANGMRTSRSNGTTTYNYVYNGSQLTQMTVGNDTLYFTYGILGPTTVTWNGTTYYYALNAQGDVIGIFDGYGNVVVTYNWDNAWGYNPMPEGSMASTLGALNPLRYRSYVYDTETGYYYLQSRYYDPEIGRFINADGLIATGQGLLGNNMFAYCGNSPVSRYDPTGRRYCMVHILDGGRVDSESIQENNLPDIGRQDGFTFSGQWSTTTNTGKYADYTERALALDISSGSYVSTDGFFFGEAELTVLEGAYDFGGVALGSKLGTAEASATVGTTGFDVGVSASLWEPYVTLGIGEYSVTFSVSIGTVGASLFGGSDSFGFKGFGWGFSISWG